MSLLVPNGFLRLICVVGTIRLGIALEMNGKQPLRLRMDCMNG